MASAGSVGIQGCAIRLSRLNADGSIPSGSATGMIVDDLPLIKLTAKPNVQAGVEITPISACGAPVISYKDFDRIKRWDVELDLGDLDFDKWEIVGGGSLLTAASSSGRTVSDGVTVLNSTTITSASGAFTSADVGRTAVGTGIPANSFIVSVTSSTAVVLNQAATAAGTGLSIVFGAIAARTVGYQVPALLTVANANGVGVEIWSKAITRQTGYQGITPYPSVGGLPVGLQSSAWVRYGIFRFIPTPQDFDIEDKEQMRVFSGWAIENPLFGTGPVHDWTVTGLAGGAPIDTTKAIDVMADFQLPTPRQAGYQTTT